MANLSRRTMLNTAALGTVALGIAACGLITSTTVNGVTTLTINVAQLNTDGQAIIVAAQAVLSNPALIPLLGANLLVAQAALATASVTMASIAKATNGVSTASIDATSVQALVKSLIADILQIVTIVTAVNTQLAGSVFTVISGYLAAIQALVPFIQLAVALATPASVTLVNHGMTEAQALAIATH